MCLCIHAIKETVLTFSSHKKDETIFTVANMAVLKNHHKPFSTKYTIVRKIYMVKIQ